MRIKVFMINGIRKPENLRVMLQRKSTIIRNVDENMIDSSEYDLVYDDKWDDQDLESVFNELGQYLFEITGGAVFMATTDIIYVEDSEAIVSGYYCCLSFGWKKVSFDVTKTERNILANFEEVRNYNKREAEKN